MAKKILIIDDEEVFRDTISRVLTKKGYQCIAVRSASEGIMKVKEESFDLILLDIMMYPLDGWDTLDQIQSLPRGKHMPIIIISAKKLLADEVIRYGKQIAGYIQKSFSDDGYSEAVSHFFSWCAEIEKEATLAESRGIPREACERWIILSRQLMIIPQLKDSMSLRCIPDEDSTEEECMARKKYRIDELIAEIASERDELLVRYPTLG